MQRQLHDLTSGEDDGDSTLTISSTCQTRNMKTQNGTVVKTGDRDGTSGQPYIQKETLNVQGRDANT